jgi:hypothetical protein
VAPAGGASHAGVGDAVGGFDLWGGGCIGLHAWRRTKVMNGPGHPLWDSVGLGGRRIRFAERVGHLADTAHVGGEVDCQRESAVRGVWLGGGGNFPALVDV